jgi:hypothetical protein
MSKFLSNANLVSDLKRAGVKNLSGKSFYHLLEMAYKAKLTEITELYSKHSAPSKAWCIHLLQRKYTPEVLAGNPMFQTYYSRAMFEATL